MTLPIFLFACFYSSLSFAQFLGISSTSTLQQHNYTGEESQLKTLDYGGQLNLQTYRLNRTGWFARGPVLETHYSKDRLSLNAQVNLHQPFLHHGLWLAVDWQQSQFQSTVSSNLLYLDNSGVATSIASGNTISSTRHEYSGHIYWYESVKDEGPINTLGLLYTLETNPASSEISSTNANVFDGRFSGVGFTIGRIKDDRGLNFQWKLTLAQLTSDFSNAVTNHQRLSKAESQIYKTALNLNWHYRYYVGPYWYIVPSAHLTFSYLMQSQLNPEMIKHEPLSFSQYRLQVSLRKYF